MNIITVDYSMATKSMDIFLSGCAMGHHCTGCHNMEAWDFNVGRNWHTWMPKILTYLNDFSGMISRIFILGGEPLDQNKIEFMKFISKLKEFDKELWLFTRYDIGDISSDIKVMFDYIKIGSYQEELSVKDYYSYGIHLATSNQKVLKHGVDFV